MSSSLLAAMAGMGRSAMGTTPTKDLLPHVRMLQEVLSGGATLLSSRLTRQDVDLLFFFLNCTPDLQSSVKIGGGTIARIDEKGALCLYSTGDGSQVSFQPLCIVGRGLVPVGVCSPYSADCADSHNGVAFISEEGKILQWTFWEHDDVMTGRPPKFSPDGSAWADIVTCGDGLHHAAISQGGKVVIWGHWGSTPYGKEHTVRSGLYTAIFATPNAIIAIRKTTLEIEIMSFIRTTAV
jgi:hypothetical protein